MRKIRKGKDIVVKWSIFRNANGEREPYSIDQLTAQLRVQPPIGEAFKADEVSIEGNMVTWTFRGKSQIYSGIYNLILVENDGADGMVTVDTCKAFALVDHSCQETPAVGGDVVTDIVMLEGEVAFAPVVIELGGEPYDDTELREMIAEQDQKLTELSAEVGTLSDRISGGAREETITEFTDKGKFLYGNSTLDSAQYNVSDYIAIEGANKVVLNGVWGASNGILPYVIYDSAKTILLKADIPSENNKFNIVLTEFPQGSAYIRCTQNSLNEVSVSVYWGGNGLETRVEILEDNNVQINARIELLEQNPSSELAIKSATKKNKIVDFTTNSAQHLNTKDGELAPSTSFTASTFIEIDESTQYCAASISEAYGGYTAITMQEICYYDASKSFISAETSKSVITTPKGAKYMRFSVLSKAYWDRGVDDMRMCEIVEGDVPISVFSQDMFADVMPKNGLMGKKWLLIGDSNTEHNARAAAKYDEFIAAYTGIVPMNIAKSGAGYRVYHNTDYVFLNILNKFYNENPTYVPDFITIMGGSNDVEFDTDNIGTYTDTTDASVFGMAKILLDRLAEIYPNVPVAIMTPFPHSYINAVKTPYLAPFVDELIKFCNYHNMPLLDLFHNSGIKPEIASYNKKYFSSPSSPDGDGLHLNYYGQRLIAPRIREYLMRLFGEF